MIDRRLFLSGGSAAAALALSTGIPTIALANAATDKRFVLILQRGAADGLSTVAPVGDPDYQSLRGRLGEESAGTRLDSFFMLHPALPRLAGLYAAHEALFVHAIASPYRERSHFDGQNVLETGGKAAYDLGDGWLNRLLGLLPAAERNALALSATVPMALRGANPVASYAPSKLQDASDDLLSRVGLLYGSDPQLHALWESAMRTRSAAGEVSDDDARNAAATGELAAKLLSAPQGPRIALIGLGGWDTHASQRGRLAAALRGLDGMIAALKSGLGQTWTRTVVVVATEFGRTARPNGTGGTDHGTGSVAMLLGGAVDGGKVVADWPGLSQASLYEGRDLKPTADLYAFIGSVVARHYGLDNAIAMRTLFPDSRSGAFGKLLLRA
ncbi:MAG TPA: DUF1501 domain-containing protein [Sphingomicrobium sp.]|nr:DUF1501 domain-containing protein [Sphingomicrobium sp.]